MLDTERLTLRKFTTNDLDTFFAYRSDPEINKFQSWTKTPTKQEAIDFIEEQILLKSGSPGKWTQIAIEEKSSAIHIGDCALFTSKDGRQGEFGITISKQFQGQGYGYESLIALFSLAFTRLNQHRIIGLADVENVASIALMKKLGMRQEASFVESYWDSDINGGEWRDEYQFAILSSEWPHY